MESTSLLPQGLQQAKGGNRHSYGMFDECLGIRSESEAKDNGTQLTGRYCTVYFRPTIAVTSGDQKYEEKTPDFPSDIISKFFNGTAVLSEPQMSDSEYLDYMLSRSSAFCLPSSCTPDDVRQAVADLVGRFAVAGRVNGTLASILTSTDERQCYVDSVGPEWDATDYTVLYERTYCNR